MRQEEDTRQGVVRVVYSLSFFPPGLRDLREEIPFLSLPNNNQLYHTRSTTKSLHDDEVSVVALSCWWLKVVLSTLR